MRDNDKGPPDSERPAPPQDRRSHRITKRISPGPQSRAIAEAAAKQFDNPDTSRTGTSVPAQLRRRRAAAQRSAPLDCSCRDGWICRCNDHGISDAQADAMIAAAETLLALGAPGIFGADQCRAMWRRGRRDLAASSHSYANPEERHDRH